jgi:hypothetical protein
MPGSIAVPRPTLSPRYVPRKPTPAEKRAGPIWHPQAMSVTLTTSVTAIGGEGEAWLRSSRSVSRRRASSTGC